MRESALPVTLRCARERLNASFTHSHKFDENSIKEVKGGAICETGDGHNATARWSDRTVDAFIRPSVSATFYGHGTPDL